MKLRIRVKGQVNNTRVAVASDATLGDLQRAIVEKGVTASLGASQLLRFSLNGQDWLAGFPSDTLHSHGIAGGDLLWTTASPPPADAGLATPTQPRSSSKADTQFAAASAPAANYPPSESCSGWSPTVTAPAPAASHDSTAADAFGFTESLSNSRAASAQPQPAVYSMESPESGQLSPSDIGDLAAAHSARPTAPGYLQRVLESNPDPETPEVALVMLAHAVFLESGVHLCEQEGYNRYSLPIGWDINKGLGTIKYGMSERFQGPNTMFLMHCTAVGRYLALTVPIARNDIRQLMLPVSEYAELQTVRADSQPTDGHEARIPSVHFLKQHQLWARVKDKFVITVKTKLCIAHGQPQPLGLLLLPSELRDRCLQVLNVEDLARVACVCRELRTASAANHLWETHLLAVSPSQVQPDAQEGSYQEVYSRYALREMRERDNRRRAYARYHPPTHPIVGGRRGRVRTPLPGYVPGVTGGDYDRLPALSSSGSLGTGTNGGLGAASGGWRAGNGLFGMGRSQAGHLRDPEHWRAG